MDFKDIIGQPVLTQCLQNAIKNNMIANAYIFNGPKGCGKKTAAGIFAAAINCSSNENKPCGFCPSCKKAKVGVSPDIKYVRPTGNTIKINQIRQIIMDTSAKPYENLFRVIIIDNGDKMTNDAQDAFLKTLEEPEGNNIFIILTQNYNTLLPTIISRCQVFNFLGISSQRMSDYLKENFDNDSEEIQFAIEKSNGIIGKAIEILKVGEFTSDDTFYGLMHKLLQGKREVMLSLSEEIAGSKEDGVRLLEFLLGWFRDVLIWKAKAKTKFVYEQKIQRLIEGYAQRIEEEEIFSIIDMIKQAIRNSDFNISIKNSIDEIFLNILEVCNDKSSRSTV